MFHEVLHAVEGLQEAMDYQQWCLGVSWKAVDEQVIVLAASGNRSIGKTSALEASDKAFPLRELVPLTTGGRGLSQLTASRTPLRPLRDPCSEVHRSPVHE